MKKEREMFTMIRILETLFEHIFSSILFALGVTFLLFLLRSEYESRNLIKNDISSKINVTENRTEYEKDPFSDIHTMTSVLYEIKETDLSIQVYIVNNEITTEMRKKFQNLNDSSEIRAYLDVGYTYSKEYIVDTEGKVVRIVYRPSF